MKTKFTIIAFLSTIFSFENHAQCPLSSAVADITLQCSGGTTNRTGVAYNPNQNLYYSVNAGNPSYPIETFAGTGGSALSSTSQGADYRGFWWNSLTNTIEGNTFNGGGIYRNDMAPSTFYATGTTSLMASSTMPNSQSMGHADIANNIVLYYNGGLIYKYQRSTGSLISSVAISGLPVPISNLNIYGVAYCGVQGGEAVVYDGINKAAYFINYNTGAYLATCTLPSTAPNASSFQMGFANSRLFLYNTSLSQWYGYRIVSNSAVSPVASPPVICNGASVVLSNTATATSSYTWSTGAQNTSITVSPSVTTAYTVIGTNTAGCTASVVITVTVNGAAPSLTVVPSSTTACLGQSVILTGTGANTYTWNNGVTNGVAFSPTATANYVLVGQNACGTATANISIPVQPLPVSASAASTVACANTAVALSATASATSYTWLPGNATGSTTAVLATTTGNYTVIASNGQCIGQAVVALSVNPSPTITVTAQSNSVCEGQSFTLTATGANTYTWTQSGTQGSTAVFTQTTNTIYSLNGTNSFGCTSGGSYGVITTPAPVLNVAASQTLLCNGGSATFTASGNSVQYSWSNGGNTPVITVNPATATIYTVAGASSNSCITTKTISVSIFVPTLSLSGNTVVCNGSSATLNATGTGTITWVGFGQMNSVIVTPSVPTTYTVSVASKSLNTTCTGSFTTFVNVNANPLITVSVTAPSNTVMCRNEKRVLTASGGTSYLWSNSSTLTSITYTATNVGTFTTTVTGSDANGCTSTASAVLKVNSCTGIAENQENLSLEIYPVPSNGDLYLSSAVDMILVLTDLGGKHLGQLILNSANNHQVSLHGLAEGVYIVSSIDGVYHRKIVVTE